MFTNRCLAIFGNANTSNDSSLSQIYSKVHATWISGIFIVFRYFVFDLLDTSFDLFNFNMIFYLFTFNTQFLYLLYLYLHRFNFETTESNGNDT